MGCFSIHSYIKSPIINLGSFSILLHYGGLNSVSKCRKYCFLSIISALACIVEGSIHSFIYMSISLFKTCEKCRARTIKSHCLNCGNTSGKHCLSSTVKSHYTSGKGYTKHYNQSRSCTIEIVHFNHYT